MIIRSAFTHVYWKGHDECRSIFVTNVIIIIIIMLSHKLDYLS